MRWQHPKHGMVPPGTFIPLAEQNGIDRRDRRMDAAPGLPRGGFMGRSRCRSASICRRCSSATAICRTSFTRSCLKPACRPGRLELEITEGVLISNSLARAVDPAAAEGARRQDRHGRFRDGLCVAVVAAIVSVRQDQDRPQLCFRGRFKPAIRRDRARGRRARAMRFRCRSSRKASKPKASAVPACARAVARSRAI